MPKSKKRNTLKKELLKYKACLPGLLKADEAFIQMLERSARKEWKLSKAKAIRTIEEAIRRNDVKFLAQIDKECAQFIP